MPRRRAVPGMWRYVAWTLVGSVLLGVGTNAAALWLAYPDGNAEPDRGVVQPREQTVPTITTDEFVSQVASAVADELDLGPREQRRIVEILTDDGQPGVIVVPPTTSPPPPPPSSTTTTTSSTTTTTTTTTTEPRPRGSIPSVDDLIEDLAP